MFREKQCDHLTPARPQAANRDFSCPALLFNDIVLTAHAEKVRRICSILRQEGIQPASLWIDFESGPYLRNGAEELSRVQLASREASKCPRCVKRFGKTKINSPTGYQQIVNESRAYSIRKAFTEPVTSIFPDCTLGNFFVYPILRLPQSPKQYPAYGWDGSGISVAMPRLYFYPGWRGGRKSIEDVIGWNILLDSVRTFSKCARVLKHDEVLVPWIGYLWKHERALAMAAAGAPIASSEAYREMVRHLMLRGAETIAVFSPYSLNDEFPIAYARAPYKALGPLLANLKDVQAAYSEMLQFNEILRKGRVLNYEVTGSFNKLDDQATMWSGVGTDEIALIRTVAFGPAQKKNVKVFNKDIPLSFEQGGGYFFVYPNGNVIPVTPMKSNTLNALYD
jgi:hypothetical protein